MRELENSDTEIIVEAAAAAVAGGQVVRGALIGVEAVDGCLMLELLDESFTQEPSLLGRQFVQAFPAFTQAHPVLLHLQHGT